MVFCNKADSAYFVKSAQVPVVMIVVDLTPSRAVSVFFYTLQVCYRHIEDVHFEV